MEKTRTSQTSETQRINTISPSASKTTSKSESPLAKSVSKSVQPGGDTLQIAVEKPDNVNEVKSYSVAVTDIATGEVSLKTVIANNQTNQVSIPGVEPGREYQVAVVANTNSGKIDLISSSKVVIAPAAKEKPKAITDKRNNAGTGSFQNIELQPKAGKVKGSNVKVTFKGLKPGQILRVTVIEGAK